jgi:hypothetical protein
MSCYFHKHRGTDTAQYRKEYYVGVGKCFTICKNLRISLVLLIQHKINKRKVFQSIPNFSSSQLRLSLATNGKSVIQYFQVKLYKAFIYSHDAVCQSILCLSSSWSILVSNADTEEVTLEMNFHLTSAVN